MSVLKVGFFADHPEAKVPAIAYGDDAGYDLYSAETISILPSTCEGVNCRFMISIPKGYYGKNFSRSGLIKRNCVVTDGGVIDSGYRGNVVVFVFNHGKKTFHVKPGDKIAQFVFMKKETVEFVIVDDYFKLLDSERGKSGFGSSDSKKVKFDTEKDTEIIKEEAILAVNDEIVISERK